MKHANSQPTICSWHCDRPTRDGAFVCDPCLDELASGLRELLPSLSDRFDPIVRIRVGLAEVGLTESACPWPRRFAYVARWCPWPRPREVVPGLWDEVQSTIIAERAISYDNNGGGAQVDEAGAVTVGLNLNENASWVATELTKAMRDLVRLCGERRIEHNAPEGWSPRSPRLVPAMAEWLAWRVDAMPWHPDVAGLAQFVHALLEYARWVVDRPATRQQLGGCPVEECDGHLSAVQGATFASCYRCRTQVEAQPLRDRKLVELGDRLCTSPEIARLSTYLGLRADRDAVNRQINAWAYRGRIEERGRRAPTPRVLGPTCASPIECDHRSCRDVLGKPLFRFGDVYALLLLAEAKADDRVARPAPPISTTSKGV